MTKCAPGLHGCIWDSLSETSSYSLIKSPMGMSLWPNFQNPFFSSHNQSKLSFVSTLVVGFLFRARAVNQAAQQKRKLIVQSRSICSRSSSIVCFCSISRPEPYCLSTEKKHWWRDSSSSSESSWWSLPLFAGQRGVNRNDDRLSLMLRLSLEELTSGRCYPPDRSG